MAIITDFESFTEALEKAIEAENIDDYGKCLVDLSETIGAAKTQEQRKDLVEMYKEISQVYEEWYKSIEEDLNASKLPPTLQAKVEAKLAEEKRLAEEADAEATSAFNADLDLKAAEEKRQREIKDNAASRERLNRLFDPEGPTQKNIRREGDLEEADRLAAEEDRRDNERADAIEAADHEKKDKRKEMIANIFSFLADAGMDAVGMGSQIPSQSIKRGAFHNLAGIYNRKLHAPRLERVNRAFAQILEDYEEKMEQNPKLYSRHWHDVQRTIYTFQRQVQDQVINHGFNPTDAYLKELTRHLMQNKYAYIHKHTLQT